MRPHTGRTESVYLCQADETVSCGACCGLYNVCNVERGALASMLTKRTMMFASVPRTEDGLYQFQQDIEGFASPERPFRQFYHCPFLGFVGSRQNRVGCLLHPASDGNDGQDYRSFGYYGEAACRDYFCPSVQRLPNRWKRIVIAVLDDWYLYGLMITEHRLLRLMFSELEKRIGGRLEVSRVEGDAAGKAALAALLAVKTVWPYRRSTAPGVCNFFFENGLYSRPDVERNDSLVPHSRFEAILRELDSGFGTLPSFRQAEALLEELFSRSADCVMARSVPATVVPF